ncbi:energy transducer TonB [Chryseobacterium sp. A301]
MKKFTQFKMSHSLDEVLFENRNKEYGAYLLRQQADSVLAKSLFVGVSLFAVATLLPILLSTSLGNNRPEQIPAEDPVWILREPLSPKPAEAQKTLPVQSTKPLETPKQIVPSVPIPTRTPEVSKEATPVTPSPVITGADTGPSIPSSAVGVGTNAGPTQGPGKVESTPTAPTQEIDPNAIYGSVDIAADFKSGIESFRSQVLQRFDSSGFTNEADVLKTTVSFVVEKDGTLSSIKASGPSAEFNKEAERTVASIKGKWKPAKVDGNWVRSSFRFPISMRIE